jgi:hypothetical protein
VLELSEERLRECSTGLLSVELSCFPEILLRLRVPP